MYARNPAERSLYWIQDDVNDFPDRSEYFSAADLRAASTRRRKPRACRAVKNDEFVAPLASQQREVP
jgi:hypothetical protein